MLMYSSILNVLFQGFFFFLQVCISAFNLLMEIICDFQFHKKMMSLKFLTQCFGKESFFFPYEYFPPVAC